MEFYIFIYIFKLLILYFLWTSFLFSNNFFIRSKLENNNLIFSFQNKLAKVKHFIIKDKKITRYVFDIKDTILPRGSKISHYKHNKIKSFKMAQYNPKTIRVVIKSKNKIKFLIKDKQFTILLFPKSLSKKSCYKIVIDAGHGGKYPGTIGINKIKEKDIVLAVAQKLYKQFNKKKYCIYLTRNSDVSLDNKRKEDLKKRTRIANDKGADIFISIHANAAPSKKKARYFKGVEIYYLDYAQSKRAKNVAAKENSASLMGKNYLIQNEYLSLINREKVLESYKLGLDIRGSLINRISKKYKDIVDNGVRSGNFWVLVGAQMPSILIELGYLTHKVEGRRLNKSSYQDILANGIMKGVEAYIDKNF